MKRTIIQISSRHISNEDEESVLALADDGTLWEGCNHIIKTNAENPGGDGKPGPAKYRYEFQWERLLDLPERYSDNFTKVR
jgi:hypothetical protein